jgi:hypothetical protein
MRDHAFPFSWTMKKKSESNSTSEPASPGFASLDESVPSRDADDALPAELNEPAVDQVYKYLMFGLSLPERTVRSTAAVISGAINESASMLVPQAFQDSKTYNTFVTQMMDFVANDVGGVTRTSDSEDEEAKVENYVARKTVSTFVDLAGMATLHVSPLTILAIVSDVAYGSKTYLNELTVELKREGVIAEDSVIHNAAELLDAVGDATSKSADVFDTPPISVGGLKETIQKTRESVANIDPSLLIPQAEIAQMWNDMQQIADKEDVNVFAVSSAVTMYSLEQMNTVTKGALTTIRVTGNLVDRHLFDHYRQGLEEINNRGIYAMLAESSQPYLDAVWFNFESNRPTVTEGLISGKMIGQAFRGVKGWLAGDARDDQSSPGDEPSQEQPLPADE